MHLPCVFYILLFSRPMVLQRKMLLLLNYLMKQEICWKGMQEMVWYGNNLLVLLKASDISIIINLLTY